MVGQTDRRMDGRMEGQTDEWMDRTDENYIPLRHTLYGGGINKNMLPWHLFS